MIRGLGRKIADFIGKDTSGKNESKQIIVILRIIVLSVAVYFTINMLICHLIVRDMRVLLFYSVFLLVFLGMFVMSYFARTIYVLWLFQIGTIVWICAILRYFGWDVGVQHFLMVLLVLYFFSDYKNYAGKILFAVCLCVLRLVLFYLYHKAIPVWQLTEETENLLQILNTITIFWCISVVALICSKDSGELEGKLIEYNNQLEKQANTDALTGLYNRRMAMEYMNKITKNPESLGGFCICICDIDYFKKVNDQYGHDYGDEVLKRIAAVLREETQGKDFAARWGGEEFLLGLAGCNGDEACVRLERVRRKIKDTRVCRGETVVSVTMTFGLAEYDFLRGWEATIKEADEKLYLGKEKGRDIIIF